MALALNVYKTVTQVVPTSAVGIYTAPVRIFWGCVIEHKLQILVLQHKTVTVSHERSVSGAAVTTEIVKDFPVPGNDTASILNGKLIMETNDIIKISGSTATDLKFIGSILETLN